MDGREKQLKHSHMCGFWPTPCLGSITIHLNMGEKEAVAEFKRLLTQLVPKVIGKRNCWGCSHHARDNYSLQDGWEVGKAHVLEPLQ